MQTAMRRPVADIDTMEALQQDNDAHLGQLDELVGILSPAAFRSRHGPDDAIGTHVRHILEHYECLLADPPHGVDYARRARDRDVEQCTDIARQRIGTIRAGLRRLAEKREPRHLTVHYTHEREAPTPQARLDSSLDRELMFLLSHTVHHMALIALLARQRGIEVPVNFGVAASTLRHRG